MKLPPDFQRLVIHGDMEIILPMLPPASCVFADPPDNIGAKYDNHNDDLPLGLYTGRISRWLGQCINQATWVWFSFNHRYVWWLLDHASLYHPIGAALEDDMSFRLFLWRFTFGQHNQHDFGNGYRPILRIGVHDALSYPDAVRVPSARQLKYNDKRADPRGRVPDDVWEFPRVCGTFKERRDWCPNQHPEALVKRIILFSTKPDDLVIEPFAGTGPAMRVCRAHNRRCISIDTSLSYCRRIADENNATLITRILS